MFKKGFDAVGTSIASFRIINLSISELGSNVPTARNITLYNVGSVLRRLFSTAEAVQYCGGCSVLRGDSISTCGGIASVLRRFYHTKLYYTMLFLRSTE